MMMSESIAALAAALVKAQASMACAPRSAKNTHFRSRYATLADVRDTVQKPLSDAGIAVVQFSRWHAETGVVEIETMLVHAESGQYMRDILHVPAGKRDAQAIGSAITYGRRYALMSMTGVAPDDDDANEAVRAVKEEQEAEPQPIRQKYAEEFDRLSAPRGSTAEPAPAQDSYSKDGADLPPPDPATAEQMVRFNRICEQIDACKSMPALRGYMHAQSTQAAVARLPQALRDEVRKSLKRRNRELEAAQTNGHALNGKAAGHA